MTSLPLWAVYAVSFGSPAAAFLAALLGHRFSRRTAEQLDRRAKREETMRTLRWAAELAVSGESSRARLGVAALDALTTSPWLQAEDQAFIDGALATLLPVDIEAYRADQ